MSRFQKFVFLKFSLAFPSSSVEVPVTWSPAFAATVPKVLEVSSPLSDFLLTLLSFSAKAFVSLRFSAGCEFVCFKFERFPSQSGHSARNHTQCSAVFQKNQECHLVVMFAVWMSQSKTLAESQLIKACQGLLKNFAFIWDSIDRASLFHSSGSSHCKALQGFFFYWNKNCWYKLGMFLV